MCTMAAKTGSLTSRVPITAEDVTIGWFQDILGINIDAASFSVTENANAGLGFLSNLVQVRFIEISSNGLEKEHCLIVKLLPSDEATRERVTADKMDKAEKHFYLNIIPELVQEMPSLESYFCPFIHGQVQEKDTEKRLPYSSVLVLRDLKQDGFIVKPFTKEKLSSEEILQGIDFLANLHASSTLLERRKGRALTDVYKDFFPEWCYPTTNKNPEFRIHAIIKSGFNLANYVISHYTTNINPGEIESGNEIISKLIEPFATHSQRLFNEVAKAGYKYPSLIHQDLWQNNIMVKSGFPSAIKVIDWQLTGYSDSAYDVAVFLVASLSSELNIRVFEDHAKLYFQKLEAIYAEKEKHSYNLLGARRRSWEDFWQALQTYGATLVFLGYTIIGCHSVAKFPENFPKIYEAFRFLYYEIGLPKFLSTIIDTIES